MKDIRFRPCLVPDPVRIALAPEERQKLLLAAMQMRGTNFVSVPLFYNLADSTRTQNVSNYQNTTVADVEAWLRLGQTPTTSDFVRSYWNALSYGNFQFGIDTNRDARNNIIIPSITPANDDGQDWGDIAAQIVKANPQRIWEISGSRVDSGRRIIPSVVVVQHYDTHASALFNWGYEFSSGGNTYRILDIFHIDYSTVLNGFGLPNTWGTMCHEYGHNFLEGSDLYGGGGGKIGYWDLLGDNSPSGHMSEVSSFYKARLGWLTFKNVINGPLFPVTEFSLQPYSTTGEAIKIVPDPNHNPGEYFLLEHRGPSVTNRNWMPDGNLQEQGLLITHINERLGDGASGSVCSSPFMDIEEADRNDGKCWESRAFCDLPWTDPGGAAAGQPGVSTYPPNNWPSWNRAAGVLYPFGGNNSFTPSSTPNSNFYGGRDSGLSITNIRQTGNEMRFTVQIAGNNQNFYRLTVNDRFFLADFNGDGKDEVLIFNGRELTLVDCEQNQFHLIWQAREWLGGWHFGHGDRLTIGDFNGDGRADVFIHSGLWAGLLLSDGQSFRQVWMTGDPTQNKNWIGQWHLGQNDTAYAGDFDGNGRDDIFIRSPQWAGLLLSTGESFENVWITGDPAQNQNWIGGWHLGPGDKHIIGDFDGDGRDDIFIRSDHWAGLLLANGGGFENVWMTGDPSQNRDWIGGWHLGPADRHYVGDFNGDGRDDIFIRSDHWAGLLLSNGRSFDNVWMTGDPAQNRDWIDGWHLGAGDRHIVGDFNGDGRDDIFIRSSEWGAVLRSNSNSFSVEWMSGDPANNWNWIGSWHLETTDREVKAHFNYDALDDIFVYRSGQRTGRFSMIRNNDTQLIYPQLSWLAAEKFAAKNPGAPPDKFFIGNFTGDSKKDIVVFNGKRLALYRNDNGNLIRIWQSSEWIGGWHLGPMDRLYIGDFNGDGRDDIFIRSPLWAGLLISNGSNFTNVWMTGDPAQNRNWIGGWHLGPGDRHYVGDFNGDGKADIYIRSDYWAGLLICNGFSFQNVWMTGDPAQNRNWIGGWHLGPMDREYIGDFNGDGKADIFIRSPHWAGLFISNGLSLQNAWMTGDPLQNRDWIGGWHLGPRDRIYVGNFTGDRRADIFIRSDHWAGLLVSNGTSFQNVWMTGDPAQNRDWIGGWHLGSRDRAVVGDLDGDGRSDIYIRSDGWVGLLVSRENRFEAALVQADRVNAWELGIADREATGRFTGAANDEIFVYHPAGWTGILTPSRGGTTGQLNLTLMRAHFRQITAR